MANEAIRSRAKENAIPYWQIGSALCVCENTVYRMMRAELSKEQKEAINGAIDRIIERRANKCEE